MWNITIRDQQNNKLADVDAMSVSIRDYINSEGVALVRIPAIIPSPTTGIASVNIAMTNGFLETWNRVEIYLIDYNSTGTKTKSLIWQGYIRNADDYLTYTEIECVDFWGYADMKRLTSKDYTTDTSVSEIASWAMNTINAVNDTGFSLVVTTSQTMKLKIEHGNSFADVLRQFVQIGLEILPKDNKLLIGDAVGRDLTGDNGITLYYNYKSPSSANIEIPRKIERFGIENANTVFWKSNTGSGKITNRTSGDEISVFKDYSEVPDSEAIEMATELVNNNSESEREIEIIPKTGDFKMGDILIGDLLRVRIDTENPLMNTDSILRVVGFQTDRTTGHHIGSITVGNKKIREVGVKNIQQELRKLQSRV